MTEFRISPDDLRRLARLVEENGLSELRYEEGDLRITLRTGGPTAVSTSAAAGDEPDFGAPFVASPTRPSVNPGGVAARPGIPIEAPVMGVFYRSPAPGEPPFVDVGDAVEVGQPVGMIEAMKVFSEVLAESAGIVREISARNGALVQPGDPLLILETPLA